MSRERPPIDEMRDEITASGLDVPVACTVAVLGTRWTTSGDWPVAGLEAVRNGWLWMREQQVEQDRRGGR